MIHNGLYPYELKWLVRLDVDKHLIFLVDTLWDRHLEELSLK